MKRRWTRSLVMLAALGALAAGAEDRKVYIKTKDTKLLKEPKATSATVGKPLAAGTEATWKGASPRDKEFHEVVVDPKTKGFVLKANLSPSKPQMEIATTNGAPMSPQAFASSGAASKALTPAAIKYAEKKHVTNAAAQVIYVEEHNKNEGTPEAIAAKAKEIGGAR